MLKTLIVIYCLLYIGGFVSLMFGDDAPSFNQIETIRKPKLYWGSIFVLSTFIVLPILFAGDLYIHIKFLFKK